MSDVILYLIMFISAGIGFGIGAFKYFRPHKPLYAVMIILGVGCIMTGKAYSFLRHLTGLQTVGIFNVGMLGTVGAFAFFFCANYGQIDSLVDGGEKKFLKYRILALSGIIVTAAIYCYILMSGVPVAEKITDGIVSLSIAAASYFHVKHIIIPDVDYGVVQCQRGYNTLALLYGLLCMLEMAAAADRDHNLFTIICFIECIVSFLLVPIVDRGVKSWSK